MPDRIAEHYQRHAHAFDAARDKRLIEREWLDRFLLPIPRGGAILDLGCGGGEPIDRYLIDHGMQLTGIDIAPNLIGLARTRFGRHRWIEGDMRTAQVEAASFEGAIAWGCIFHLDHAWQAEMIARIARWLKRGGMLLFNTGTEHGEVIGAFEGDPLYHASLAVDEYRTLLAANGLIEVGHRVADPHCGGATVWLARRA